MRMPASTARREAAELVAVVVRHEDVGDAVDAELVEVVEHGAVAEVDEHRLAPRRST